MFKIPTQIVPDYANFKPVTLEGTLKIGSAIKDMPAGAYTPTKRENDEKVSLLRAKFTEDSKEYEQTHAGLTVKANEAKETIGNARWKKIAAITAVSIAVLGVVGLTVAAAMTGTLPLLFAAAPFVVGIVPASYFTDLFRKEVSGLEATIRAPDLLRKPSLNLPVYNAVNDYDLLQSRIDVQNAFAQMSLVQIAESGVSVKSIVNYALLDRVAKISEDKRPEFYSKCTQLIKNFGAMVKRHREYQGTLDREYLALESELQNWTTKERNFLDGLEHDLKARERELARLEHDRRHGAPVQPVWAERWRLDSSFADLQHRKDARLISTERRRNEISQWRSGTREMIDRLYRNAVVELELRFGEAKVAAV